MKTSLRTLFLTFVFTMLCTAMAFAYNPGQRTIHLLGETLNSDKHPSKRPESLRINYAG